MSRWSDVFTKHPFQAEWKALLKLLPDLKIDDESIITSVEELARLRKAIRDVGRNELRRMGRLKLP